MQKLNVSDKVWQRLLDVRSEKACACCGDFSESEQEALNLYSPIARRDNQQLIIGQIGQSLDGRVATVSGDSGEVSGPDGIVHLHRIRALVDGVIIGVKTALHDSPRLTVRLCEGQNPARIVIDPNGRLPNDSPVLADDGTRRFVIQAVETTRPGGVEVIRLEAHDGQFSPNEIVEALRSKGMGNLLVEGGSYTIAKFIESELLGRIHISIAPLLIGKGPSGLTMSNHPQKLINAIRPDTVSYSLGSDVVFDCGLLPDAIDANKPLHG